MSLMEAVLTGAFGRALSRMVEVSTVKAVLSTP
jgi:hypothetical protein